MYLQFFVLPRNPKLLPLKILRRNFQIYFWNQSINIYFSIEIYSSLTSCIHQQYIYGGTPIYILLTLKEVIPKIINKSRKRLERARERKRIAALTKGAFSFKPGIKPNFSNSSPINNQEHFNKHKNWWQGKKSGCLNSYFNLFSYIILIKIHSQSIYNFIRNI